MGETIGFLKFNQDYTFLGVGTDEGWAFHGLDNNNSNSSSGGGGGVGNNSQTSNNGIFKLEKTHQASIPNGGIRLFDRVFSSSLAAMVAVGSPRKLQIINITTGTEMFFLYFSSSILNVRLNRSRMVVLLEEKIYIYEIPLMKLYHVINLETPCSEGIMDLCSNADNALLAYPISNTAGIIQVFHTVTKKANYTIPAHTSPVAAIAFSYDGTFLATASEKGTIIRVFRTTSTNEGCRDRVFEYRRGIMRSASISSMVFSLDNQFLAVSSDTETIHIFKLLHPEDAEESEDTWVSWFKASLPLPDQVNKILYEERAFATITSPGGTGKLSALSNVIGVGSGLGAGAGGGPGGSSKNILAFKDVLVHGRSEVWILVASYDGHLYAYGLNVEQGGPCPLIKQFTFAGKAEHHLAAAHVSKLTMQNQYGYYVSDPVGPSGAGQGQGQGQGQGMGLGLYSALTESAYVPSASAVMGAIGGFAGIGGYGVGLIQSMLGDVKRGKENSAIEQEAPETETMTDSYLCEVQNHT